MKLYYAPASSYSQRVLIALYEKNAAFTPIEVDLFNPEARARYTQINPFAKIPTLETNDGHVLFEACVIIEYLDLHCHNEPRLGRVFKLVVSWKIGARKHLMLMNRGDLSNEQWQRLEPLLPPLKPRTGKPNRDHRQVVNGILWILRTGAPWRDLR